MIKYFLKIHKICMERVWKKTLGKEFTRENQT